MSENASSEKKISKSMLIIKSDPNALKGVEQFLKNRDWFLGSTHQMKDAIMFLVQNKPSFVIVSVDHPNRKMQKLPKIISSAFPCCVMVYAEKATTASFKLLMDSGIEYKINPPVTGPAVERAVNKYIRDQEQAAKQGDPTALDASGKNQFDFQVEVKSGGEKASGMMSFKGGEGGGDPASSLAQSLLAQLNSDDGDTVPPIAGPGAAGINQSTGAKSQTGGVINFQTDQKSGSDVTGMSASQRALEQSARQNGSQSGGDFNLKEGGKKSGDLIINPNQPKPGEPGYLGGEGSGSNGMGSLGGTGSGPGGVGSLGGMGSGQKKGASGAHDQDPNGLPDVMIGNPQKKKSSSSSDEPGEGSSHDLYVPNGENKKPQQLGDLTPQTSKKQDDVIYGKEVEDKASRKRESADSIKIREGSFFESDSVFIKGVNQALDDTAVKGDGQIQQELEDNTHLACIIVESVRFSGYLVAALGKDKKIDNNFVELVRTKLVKFLKDNGEPIENESNMQIKVKRVDFEGWALEYAQFLRRSVHKGDEVAMAFFPFADAQVKVGESATPTMVSIKTEEIQTGVPLEFNMYIYLPTNKKYILYTPQGGTFLTEQKARLVRQGVQKMHIQKDDVQNLSKFKAQNHLNSLIKEFENGKVKAPAKKKKAA